MLISRLPSWQCKPVLVPNFKHKTVWFYMILGPLQRLKTRVFTDCFIFLELHVVSLL